MAKLDNHDKDTLEAMIDGASVCEVLAALAEICDGKAEHVLTNWQDKALAREWTATSKALTKAERAIEARPYA